MQVLTAGLGIVAWGGARGMGGLLDREEHEGLLLSPDQRVLGLIAWG